MKGTCEDTVERAHGKSTREEKSEETKNKQKRTNRKGEIGGKRENGGKRGKRKRTTFASSSVWKRG